MATKAPPINPARLASIVAGITTSITPMVDSSEHDRAVKDQLDAARAETGNVRRATLRRLATAASAGDWSKHEIDAAAGEVITSLKDLKAAKSIGTFVGEAKRFMHPMARDHVEAMDALCAAAWSGEKENAKNGADTPLARAFVREYHMLCSIAGLASTGRVIVSADRLIEFAHENDPNYDLDKVIARLEGMAGDLSEIAARFDSAELRAAVAAIASSSKAKLDATRKAAAARELAEENERLEAHKVGDAAQATPDAAGQATASYTMPTYQRPTVVASSGTLCPTGEVLAGPVDILDLVG